ncbi:MAG: MBL fold metallo-hydrolase [Henriciella sp.]|nr:MBL fold metallo-hydrolase [Henriciella sp.]
MSAQRTMTFTLLGTGSSGGVPRVGNDWGACDPGEPKNRRRRCSALLDVYQTANPDQKSRILIDTSPDLREQLLSANVGHLDAVLFTHDHADQTHGIDDIRALAIRQRRQIPAYMDAPTSKTLIPKFRYCFEGQGGYPPILDLQPMLQPYRPLEVGGSGGSVELVPLVQQHGAIQSLGFKIGRLAYCNDVSDLPEATLRQLDGLEVLVIDALRYTPHPTHAHLERVLEWVERLQPRKTVLTNLHVDMDYETLVRQLPTGVVPGFDGWAISLDL